MRFAFSVPQIPKTMNYDELSSNAGFFNAKSAAGEVRLLERLHALEAAEVQRCVCAGLRAMSVPMMWLHLRPISCSLQS